MYAEEASATYAVVLDSLNPIKSASKSVSVCDRGSETVTYLDIRSDSLGGLCKYLD